MVCPASWALWPGSTLPNCRSFEHPWFQSTPLFHWWFIPKFAAASWGNLFATQVVLAPLQDQWGLSDVAEWPRGSIHKITIAWPKIPLREVSVPCLDQDLCVRVELQVCSCTLAYTDASTTTCNRHLHRIARNSPPKAKSISKKQLGLSQGPRKCTRRFPDALRRHLTLLFFFFFLPLCLKGRTALERSGEYRV